jgi:ABC-2 type transport system ATP-binding protein
LQARLTGAERIVLRVRGDASELAPMLCSIRGVIDVSIHDDSIEIDTTAGQEIRPLIAKAVLQAGYDIIELRAVSMSLEEIFLKLTRDETPPPEIVVQEEKNLASIDK